MSTQAEDNEVPIQVAQKCPFCRHYLVYGPFVQTKDKVFPGFVVHQECEELFGPSNEDVTDYDPMASDSSDSSNSTIY